MSGDKTDTHTDHCELHVSNVVAYVDERMDIRWIAESPVRRLTRTVGADATDWRVRLHSRTVDT